MVLPSCNGGSQCGHQCNERRAVSQRSRLRTAFQRSTKEGPIHEQRTRGMDDLLKTVSLEGMLGLRVEHTHLPRSTTTSLEPCRLSLHGKLRILFRPSSPHFDAVGTRTLRLCVKNLLVAAIEGTPITALATRKGGYVTA